EGGALVHNICSKVRFGLNRFCVHDCRARCFIYDGQLVFCEGVKCGYFLGGFVGEGDDLFRLAVPPPQQKAVQAHLEPVHWHGGGASSHVVQHGQVVCVGDDVAKVEQ